MIFRFTKDAELTTESDCRLTLASGVKQDIMRFEPTLRQSAAYRATKYARRTGQSGRLILKFSSGTTLQILNGKNGNMSRFSCA